MPRRKRPKNPSRLPGTYESRVFIGGSYEQEERSLLDELDNAVSAEGFMRLVADQYLMDPEQIHDQTLYLLHSCDPLCIERSYRRVKDAILEVRRWLRAMRKYGRK